MNIQSCVYTLDQIWKEINIRHRSTLHGNKGNKSSALFTKTTFIFQFSSWIIRCIFKLLIKIHVYFHHCSWLNSTQYKYQHVFRLEHHDSRNTPSVSLMFMTNIWVLRLFYYIFRNNNNQPNTKAFSNV